MKLTHSRYFILFYLLCTCQWVLSQIPTRIIVNPSFEFPATGCSPANYNFIPQNNVNGWRTLDSALVGTVSCGSTGASASNLIEIWTSGFLSRNARTGNQFAEINGNNATFLYQEICLMANEVVPFSVWHLSRNGSGTEEQMVAELKTINNINISSAMPDTARNGWTNYSGTLTNDSTAGVRRYGFRAISGGSQGNLIDDVSIALRPLTDIKSFENNLTFESENNTLYIYVNGTLNGTATVNIGKSGNANYLNDYTIGNASRGTVNTDSNGNITLTLSPGDYDPNISTGATAGLISIPFQIVNDNNYEFDETLTYTITGSANGGNGNVALNLSTGINGQSAACGTIVGTAQFFIKDFIAMPIKLIAFTAEKRNGFNLIKWQVAEEDNIAKYILEYSLNRIDFKTIAEVNYAPAVFNNYYFEHYTKAEQTAYYRLKALDKYGKISILENVIELTETTQNSFNIFPNPSNGYVTVSFFSTTNSIAQFTLCDILGKTITSISYKVEKGNNTIALNFNNILENGIYYVRYSNGKILNTTKVTVFK